MKKKKDRQTNRIQQIDENFNLQNVIYQLFWQQRAVLVFEWQKRRTNMQASVQFDKIFSLYLFYKNKKQMNTQTNVLWK